VTSGAAEGAAGAGVEGAGAWAVGVEAGLLALTSALSPVAAVARWWRTAAWWAGAT
jgi:hypothetical protein